MVSGEKRFFFMPWELRGGWIRALWRSSLGMARTQFSGLTQEKTSFG